MTDAGIKKFIRWDLRFLELAQSVSTWSKDPSTKCGAVAVKHNRVIGMGYNGFPQGIADDHRLHVRKTKLELILHAEDNLFLSSKADLSYAFLYTWPIPPCHECAKKLIQAGIIRVIAPKPYGAVAKRYADSFEKAEAWYEEAKVHFTFYDIGDPSCLTYSKLQLQEYKTRTG